MPISFAIIAIVKPDAKDSPRINGFILTSVELLRAVFKRENQGKASRTKPARPKLPTVILCTGRSRPSLCPLRLRVIPHTIRQSVNWQRSLSWPNSWFGQERAAVRQRTCIRTIEIPDQAMPQQLMDLPLRRDRYLIAWWISFVWPRLLARQRLRRRLAKSVTCDVLAVIAQAVPPIRSNRPHRRP
jgi:hypothetical protein